MFPRVCIVILTLQMTIGAGFDWCSLTCGSERHSMCIYREGGGESCRNIRKGLTAEEKEAILEQHNQLRSKVANGEESRQPPASDMNQLVWDDEVAEIAQRWVDQCDQGNGGHDKCRNTKDGVQVGQNYAASWGYGTTADRTSTVNSLIQAWYNEVKYMNAALVDRVQFNGPVIGHYTQLVWGKTTRVGCGLAHKQEGESGSFEIKLVCNYKPTGNYIGQSVYTEGATASKCAKKSTKYPGLCVPQKEGDNPKPRRRQSGGPASTHTFYTFFSAHG